MSEVGEQLSVLNKVFVKNEMRHQRGCGIVILCIVELVAEVDGHDAVGDVSVPAKTNTVIRILEF